MERALRVNGRVVLLTLLLLAGLDVVLEHLLMPAYFAAQRQAVTGDLGGFTTGLPVRRLPADDANTLALWKQQLLQAQGFTVVFLGDSVVFGGGVADERDSIPAYFAAQARTLLPALEVEVFNFSLPGCTPADAERILAYLADTRPHLVIYDANLGWFGQQRVEEHPRLAELVPAAGEGGQESTGQGETVERVEDWLSQAVSQHWSLYRNRILLNYLWFGKPLKERLQLRVEVAQPEEPRAPLGEEELYRPWYEKNFDALRQTKGKLGRVRLDDGNPHWAAYRRLVQRLGAMEGRAAVFMVPRNQVLYERYDLLDAPALQERQADLAREARAQGVAVYDFTYAVPDRYFTDTVHLTAAGNREIARRLLWELVADGIMR
ncbi:MAG: hypothetical protein NUV35_06815 [Syntrophomonadaceae bacterium]|nr:hypothetical protein [Syntrophomonadaceae bacterium]